MTSITKVVNENHRIGVKGSPGVSSPIFEMKSMIKRNKDEGAIGRT